MIPDSELKPMVTKPEQVHDEGMLRLGEKCIEDMTREYIKRHSTRDVESYKNFLRHNLTCEHWLHSIIDPETVIACMDRVRNDKIRTQIIGRFAMRLTMKCGFEITVVCSLALAFLIIGDSANLTARQEKIAVDTTPPYFEKILPLPTEKEEVIEEEHHAELEESPTDISFLFYATQPIGRYYITAYNHKETGSKITASGKTVHQGTITSAAGDVWGGYFKFGDYIECDSRIFRIEDTGSAVKRKHVDLYFASYRDMARYGSNYQTIYKVSFPFGVPKDE